MERQLLKDSSPLSSEKSDATCSSETWVEEKQQRGKVRLAVVAGFFATVGSLFGKLAGNFALDSVDALLLKGVLLILMVTSNTVGCTFFTKALNSSGSSLPCTIASAATSYACSALAGFFIFDETTSIKWWCGISFVILGLLFICNAPSKSDSATASIEKSKRE